ncbi:Sugar transporter protein [Operophtera brumata]|uniref:Sugar transporter protein n=1 Tax=Operophtera brumata TaxID=104452 RepID=A0A0L7LIB6_OPEBR|nr:Sugar transporter protein [Operophtera brumata]
MHLWGLRIEGPVMTVWTVLGVLLSILAQGMEQGYMSVLLTALRRPDSSIKIDVHLASWLVYGRKIAYILELLPSIIALLLIHFATDFPTLMVARLLDGITAGGTVILGAVVIGEYTDPSNRGMFLNLKTACICLGSTVIHGLGHYIHWRTAALVNLAPHVVALMMVLTWKESPAWLASKRMFDECKSSFLWLRGDSEKCRKELNRLISSQEEKRIDKTTKLANIRSFFKKFTRKDFLKPVSILFLNFVLLEMCGRHILPAYAGDIIGGIVGDHGGSFYYTLGIDLIVTISSTFSSVLIKFMKIRTLLFSSGVSSLLALGSACLYLLLESQGIISKDKPWIPMSMFIVYFILVNLGCTPIPLALIGELLPLEHKSSGIFASSVLSCVLIVVTLKVFPYLLLTVEIYGTFALLGSVMAVILVSQYFVLPETKGRTLQEIEDCMKYGEVRNESENVESIEKMLH